MINFLIPAALLLCGSLTGAQESRIRNFQVVSQNDTHITFSWEIVDGYFSSSDISYFQLYYEYRASSTYSIYIRFSDTTQNGTTFTYTSPLEAFINNYNYYYNYADGYGFGKYIIWTQAYRSGLIPRYTYSERLYVDLGLSMFETVLELKVQLGLGQTCSDVTGTYYAINREMNWLLLQSCQCALPYYFTASQGYFTCTPHDYVVYRVKYSSPYESSFDLTALKANLTGFIATKATIILNGRLYFISPGPCGLTVPAFDSPHCFNDSLDSEESLVQPVTPTSQQDKMTSTPITMTAAPTTTSAALTTTSAAPTTTSAAPTTTSAAPTTTSVTHTIMSAAPSTTSAPPTITASAHPVVTAEDNLNTLVIAVVSAMCGATMIMMLGVGTLVVILFMKMKTMASKQIPLSQLHWHSGAKEDTPWVLSDDHDAVDSTSQQSVVILKSAGADEL